MRSRARLLTINCKLFDAFFNAQLTTEKKIATAMVVTKETPLPSH